MNRAQPAAADRRDRRSGTILWAFLGGLPLTGLVLYAVHFGPLRDQPIHRYLSHPVECVELGMFFCALGALLGKLWQWGIERGVLRKDLLPRWDGKTIPVSEAGELLAKLEQRPRSARSSLLGRRLGAVLDFLRCRGSAADLDDQLRSLADNDSLALENSYSLIRFITWAIPILGFLGTVLGITGAISGVTPEVLEKSLSTVTDGLALAFDATALALGLTMVIMFVSFLVERCEQGMLERVDQYVEEQLAHRFERGGNEFVGTLRQTTQGLVRAMEQLVERQAAVWSKSLEEADRRRLEAEKRAQETLSAGLESALERTLEADHRRLEAEKRAQETLSAGLESALDRTLEAHAARLAALEKQAGGQAALLIERLGKIADGLAGQAAALRDLQDGEQLLLRLQEGLQRNLSALAGAGAFEQAVHSLTAAIHLLTGQHPTRSLGKSGRPGAAA